MPNCIQEVILGDTTNVAMCVWAGFAPWQRPAHNRRCIEARPGSKQCCMGWPDARERLEQEVARTAERKGKAEATRGSPRRKQEKHVPEKGGSRPRL